ncbi:MAG: VCBS repeat-containing protein [Planctomycetota bacterium]
MRARPLACLLLASLAAAAEDVVMLRGRADPRIEVVAEDGTVRQRVCSAAWVVALPTGGPALIPLSSSEALCAWGGRTFTALSVLRATPDGVVELGVSTIPAGWAVQGAADFDGDGRGDVILYRREGDGDDCRYSCAVALGKAEAGFEMVAEPTQVVDQCRGAYFAAGDVDGDGRADLLFQSFAYGGSCPTQLFVLAGKGDGTFAPAAEKRLVLDAPEGSTTPILCDLDRDGDLDVFLPPDDDVNDEGQCHVAFNRGDGQMEGWRPSIDLRPDVEGSTSDAFIASGSAADVDGDGQADLVLTGYDILAGGGVISVYKRKADGDIDPEATVVAEGDAGLLPALGWLCARGKSAPRGEEPSAERLTAWWADLSGERPGPQARAVGAFVGAGAAAVPFLASKLPSEPAMDEARIRRLVADLDADEWETREQATLALTDIVDVAEPLLQEALADSASSEARTRIERILDSRAPLRPQDAPTEDLLPIRVIGLLEAIGTEDAYAAIRRVAASGAPPSVRRFAAEALERR